MTKKEITQKRQGYDLYMVYNGKKIASIRSYSASLSSSDGYRLKLEYVYPTEAAFHNGIDFSQLPRFDVVIDTPERRIIYTDCQAQEMNEYGGQTGWYIDTVLATAEDRTAIAIP